MNADRKPRRFSLQEWIILLVTAAYVLPALALSWSRANSEFVMYAAVLVILMGFILLLHYFVHLHMAALWGLSCWGLAHMMGGLMPIPQSWPVNPGEPHVLYNLWLLPGVLKYDQLVHAAGFGLTTWICWQSLARSFANRGVTLRPSFGLLVLCIAAGMGLGALNEVIEFLATRIMPQTNVGGYENTGWDLVSNLVGCVLAGLLISASKRSASFE
jgi:hypothetical protein